MPYNTIVGIENDEVTTNIKKVTNMITGIKSHEINPPGKMDNIPMNPVHIIKFNRKNGIHNSLINNIIFRISLRTFGMF